MTDYTDIIARLEKATGPDRELDLEIGRALPGPHPFSLSTAQQRGGKPPVPEFTASIDAALMLMPEGANWSLNSKSEARVGGPRLDFVIKGGSHVVPAIALCIAALKARAAQSSLPANGE